MKTDRRNLCEYSTPLTDLQNEDGTLTFSRRESITKRFYTDLFRSSTPVPSPSIPAREGLSITPSEVHAAFKSMNDGIAAGPDFISTELRAGGHSVRDILASHITYVLSSEGTNNREVEELAYCLSSKSAAEKTFESTYHPAHLLLLYKLLTEIIIARILRALDETICTRSA